MTLYQHLPAWIVWSTLSVPRSVTRCVRVLVRALGLACVGAVLLCTSALVVVAGLEALPTLKTVPLTQTRLEAVIQRGPSMATHQRLSSSAASTAGGRHELVRPLAIPSDLMARTYGFAAAGAASTSSLR